MTTETPEHDIDAFLDRNSRLPSIGDAIPPWQYRGWLLRYVIMGHMGGKCSDRWGYHLRQMRAGKLLDEPIPQLIFGRPDRAVSRQIREWSEIVCYDNGGWSDFRKLVEWLAWGLQVGDELPELTDDKHEKLYRTVNLAKMLDAPYDYFGNYICDMRGNSKWNPSGFFPTPHEVVKCMTAMMDYDTKEEGQDSRVLTVNDPCLGTGRMLMEASNYSLRLYGQDIDSLVLTCCKINFALYVPWGAFPYKDEFFSGNMSV